LGAADFAFFVRRGFDGLRAIGIPPAIGKKREPMFAVDRNIHEMQNADTTKGRSQAAQTLNDGPLISPGMVVCRMI